MLRKQILANPQARPAQRPGEIDIIATATVQLTSEDPAHPIDHVFDHQRGPGGSRWIAAQPGEQTIVLVFDTPQSIHRIMVEIEEPAVSRTQELTVAVSSDGGQTYQELVRQEYTFSPPGTTFEREEWIVNTQGVTHVRLWIKPDKGGQPCRATVTSLVLERTPT